MPIFYYKSAILLHDTNVYRRSQKQSWQRSKWWFCRNYRKQGGIIFLVVRDITGTIQTVVIKGNTENFEKVANLSLESVVSVIGEAKENSQAPNGIEVFIESVEVLSVAQPELPIPVNEKGEGETNLDTA